MLSTTATRRSAVTSYQAPTAARVSPIANGVRPRAARAIGMPSRRANQLAGTAAAASAERTTTGLVTTDRGRKPSGRERTRSTTAGTPTTISATPASAAPSPADGLSTVLGRP